MLPWGGTTWPLGKRQDGSVPTTSIPCSPAWDNRKQCWTNSWKLDCLCHNDCLFPDGCVCLWPAVLSSPLFLALQSAASLSPCGCLPSAHAAGCVLCWAWGHHCHFSQSGACTLMGSGPSPLFSHLGSAFVTQQCFLLSELCILRTRKAWAVEREGRVHRGWSQQLSEEERETNCWNSGPALALSPPQNYSHSDAWRYRIETWPLTCGAQLQPLSATRTSEAGFLLEPSSALGMPLKSQDEHSREMQSVKVTHRH